MTELNPRMDKDLIESINQIHAYYAARDAGYQNAGQAGLEALAEVERLPDSTLGGLARTLMGLLAEGAKPEQELRVVCRNRWGAEVVRTSDYEVRRDEPGTPEEHVELEFDIKHIPYHPANQER